jgi:hypothetical protein
LIAYKSPVSPSENLTRRDPSGTPRRVAFYRRTRPDLDNVRSQLFAHKLWLDPDDYAASRDPKVLRKMFRDSTIQMAAQFRLSRVAGAEWFLDSKVRDSRPLIPHLEHLMNMIPNFAQSRMALANGIFEGRSWLKMYSGRKRFRMPGDTQERVWWYPAMLGHISAGQIIRGVEQVREADSDGLVEKQRYYWATMDPTSPGAPWLRVEDDQLASYVRLHYHDDALTYGYGTPLTDALYQTWYAKTHLWEMMLRHADRYGTPQIVATMRADATTGVNMGEDLQSQSARRAQLVADIEKQRAGNVIALDDAEKIEVFSTRGEDSSGLRALLEYCNEELTRTILASSMPFGGGGDAGSYARAQTERSSTDDLLAFDRTIMGESLQSLVVMCFEMNRQNFAHMQDGTGRFLHTMGDILPTIGLRSPDSGVSVENVERALTMGLPVRRQDAYKALGLTMPDEDDDVIQPPGFGGGGGPPGMGGPATDVFGGPAPGANSTVTADGVMQ